MFVCLEEEFRNVSETERQANLQGELELHTGLALL